MESQANNNTSVAERVSSFRKSMHFLTQSRSVSTIFVLIVITYCVYFMYYLGTVNSDSSAPPFTFTINRAKFCDTDSKSSFKLPDPEQLEKLIRRNEGSGDTY